MITRRLRDGSSTPAPAEMVAFQSRLNDEDRRLLKVAREKLRLRFGGEPSNPVLLSELLKSYVASAA